MGKKDKLNFEFKGKIKRKIEFIKESRTKKNSKRQGLNMKKKLKIRSWIQR